MKTWISYSLALLLFGLVNCAKPLFAAEAVGYINILSGTEPEKTFVLERKGEKITPQDTQTDVEEGDVITPAKGAHILFVPNDVSCEEVEITSPLTASKCPRPEKSMPRMAYDMAANQFMAAPAETVAMYATRGADDDRVYTLLRETLLLAVEGGDDGSRKQLQAEIGRMPFIGFTSDSKKADLKLVFSDTSTIALQDKDGTGLATYRVPADFKTLRLALNNRINFKTISRAGNAKGKPSIECLINVYAPTEANAAGAIEHDGQKWLLEDRLVLDKVSSQKNVSGERLLSFSIKNNRDKDCYVYIVNFTNEGQILNILPPESDKKMKNVVKAGETLSLSGIELTIGSPVESILFLASTKKLDLGNFGQENFASYPKGQSMNETLRPVRQNQVESVLAVFNVSSN